MNSKNSHVEEFLKYYCSLDRDPGYAVLLKGKWGTGKTWFIKRFFRSLKESSRKEDESIKHLYVSLYGVTSFDEIENEFFKQLHPKLSSKTFNVVGNLAAGVLKAALKTTLNYEIPGGGIDLPEYLTKTDGYVIVFDDLERATINIESLLGYINHYVEYQGYKVIIVANEEEILTKQESNENSKCSYRRIKEKLIGKTFKIEHDLQGILDDFIEEINDDKVKNLYISNKILISDVFNKSKYKNLRCLKQTLYDFERFVTFVNDDAKTKSDLMSNLLKIFSMLSYEIQSGEMLPKDIYKATGDYATENGHKLRFKKDPKGQEAKKLQTILNKYDISSPDLLLDEAIWSDFFDKAYCDKKTIKESLEKSRYYRTTDDWEKLYFFETLTEKEFTRLYESVKNDFENKKFTELGVVKHVVGIFLVLSEKKIRYKKNDDILKSSYSHIDHLKKEGLINEESPREQFYSNTVQSWGGYYFKNHDSREFEKLTQYIEQVREQVITEKCSEIGSKLWDIMVNNPGKFYGEVSSYSKNNTSYYNRPIFKDIDSKSFVDQLISTEPAIRYEVCLAIIFNSVSP
ncbi:MAG: P-loop NTPase fold protein [Candidatus Endonucleobacter sp. (ex Gigantidas childressi)]|nr:P-loop NTPase fold protein [Candidatus Endonucleobacter sp. (ex Gigantidas childressi)]